MYIFEDCQDNTLCQLFNMAYSDEVQAKFLYANGNGNLKKLVTEILNNSEEELYVFMDMVPDNYDIVKIYRKLAKLSQKNNYKVMVLPIICREYYAIKAFKDLELFKENKNIDICLNKLDYTDVVGEDIYGNALKNSVNFENFCKNVLASIGKTCLALPRYLNEDAGWFYKSNCPCAIDSCVSLSLSDKVEDNIRAFQYIPRDSYYGTGSVYEFEEAWCIHRRLVDDYNEWVRKYNRSNESYIINYIK